MANEQERLKQVRIDIILLQEEEKRLIEQSEQDNIVRFGDIVTCPYGQRVILFDPNDRQLKAFSKDGISVGSELNYYSKTGTNIFKDGLLNLNY